MNNSDVKNKKALGFLTVVTHPQHGLFGGYLLLNTSGRPLEFHCTAPIKPNRAQEILYGPTLESFLYGEQIGQTLIRQGGVVPLLVCTDQQAALAAREFISIPLVMVLPPSAGEQGRDEKSAEPTAVSQKTFRVDAAHGDGCRLMTFQLGRNRLALPDGAEEDHRTVSERIADLADVFDLAEPFQRIRDAIEEAQQAMR